MGQENENLIKEVDQQQIINRKENEKLLIKITALKNDKEHWLQEKDTHNQDKNKQLRTIKKLTEGNKKLLEENTQKNYIIQEQKEHMKKEKDKLLRDLTTLKKEKEEWYLYKKMHRKEIEKHMETIMKLTQENENLSQQISQ